MTHPKLNTQAITTRPNAAQRNLDEQLEKAKKAFSQAKATLVRSNIKCKYVSPAVADRMPMLQPRHMDFFDNKPFGLPRNESKQCRVIATVIAGMFPVSSAQKQLQGG